MELTPQIIKGIALDADDFGFEMRVGAILRNATGAEVSHGGTYTDYVTSLPRQFDYRFHLETGELCIQLAVECKNLHEDSPLVVCGAKRTAEETYHEIVASVRGSIDEPHALVKEFRSCTLRVAPISDLYPRNLYVGKSVLRIKQPKSGNASKQPFSGFSAAPDGDIYERWSQALSSSMGMCIAACDFRKHREWHSYFTITLPTVVVPDGALWMLMYDETGKVEEMPTQVDNCTLFSGHRFVLSAEHGREQDFTISHIHILTMTGLEKLIGRITGKDLKVWQAWFPEAVLDRFKCRVRFG